MATDMATLSQLLQASLDPRQNKQGKYRLLFISILTIVQHVDSQSNAHWFNCPHYVDDTE